MYAYNYCERYLQEREHFFYVLNTIAMCIILANAWSDDEYVGRSVQ
jgi:hypothetical protein